MGWTVGIHACVRVRMCMYSRNSRLCHAELCCAEAQASVGIRSG